MNVIPAGIPLGGVFLEIFFRNIEKVSYFCKMEIVPFQATVLKYYEDIFIDK